ncbi:hypothetical protein JAO76_05845 [Pontibacter sp. BT310]|uniref:Cardiolipin synthase N-terminal domain-containing protein n=1 Tax=Pontibacter populi TaxID=890055 RepID=A0ABS6XA71_9BACT|nr:MULTISPECIES: hypothetical protein [Pontibacter]MBJ6117702.1 hypothetical protein [Pontibacter sp. BT310]MBR0570128.1 hypothetical protein [Microvirga sp. STS03]MBW3364554.1 hypothetical protein [Pontibacter populi]
MERSKLSFWVWLFYFILFEVVVYLGLSYLLSGIGESNQLQEENTVVPNWVKAVVFILLYLLCMLIAVMVVSNMVPNKYRPQLMRWVYLGLLGLPVMLILLFN